MVRTVGKVFVDINLLNGRDIECTHSYATAAVLTSRAKHTE